MDRIKLEHTEVYGFIPALRGMRNPMDSWHLADSILYWDEEQGFLTYDKTSDVLSNNILMGDKDLSLATRLITAGGEHCKFLRMIQVWTDITVPRYIWSELDTYKFNTKNSCSTMHKLFNAKSKLTLDQFIYDEKDKRKLEQDIEYLNEMRLEYLETKNKDILRRAKQILPEGFLQKRTWNTNYQELLNIYFQRRYHRLDDWKIVCKWIESLPYMDMFIQAMENRRK